MKLERRQFVRGTGTLVSTGSLAGCLGGGGGRAEPDDVDDETRKRIDAWLSDASNYQTAFKAPEPGPPYDSIVKVGAEGNGGNHAFDPPAWVVSTGRKVVWQWTELGGKHNVVSASDSDFEFRSGEPRTDPDPFERSFDEPGVALYYCESHRDAGMKGAVVVVDV